MSDASKLREVVDRVLSDYPLPRCTHGNALRDHAGDELSPSCGCYLETDGTSAPVCPYCGKRMGDACELGLDDGEQTETECGTCGRRMVVAVDISVSYTTMYPSGEKTP